MTVGAAWQWVTWLTGDQASHDACSLVSGRSGEKEEEPRLHFPVDLDRAQGHLRRDLRAQAYLHMVLYINILYATKRAHTHTHDNGDRAVQCWANPHNCLIGRCVHVVVVMALLT